MKPRGWWILTTETHDCRAYNDFREVLAREDVDAVYIATPDHWHALITIAAARAGKDVYCQKPLTRTMVEGQAVVEAVHRYGTVFQHGTQQRHDPRMLFGCELVRNGYIGQLRHVKIGSPAAITTGPQPTQPVPPGLDWEMWVGPAPWAPFTPLRIAAHPWYHISDYCMGYIAGWGVHHADSAAQGSGVDEGNGLIEVNALGMFPTDGLFDNAYRWQMHYTFPGGLTWHWTDCQGDGFGSVGPADWPQNQMGIRFEGSEGWVFIWRGVVDAHPKSLLDVKIGRNDKVRFNRPGGEPIPDFIQCVRRRLKTCAPGRDRPSFDQPLFPGRHRHEIEPQTHLGHGQRRISKRRRGQPRARPRHAPALAAVRRPLLHPISCPARPETLAKERWTMLWEYSPACRVCCSDNYRSDRECTSRYSHQPQFEISVR